jgi:hypothetical protein
MSDDLRRLQGPVVDAAQVVHGGRRPKRPDAPEPCVAPRRLNPGQQGLQHRAEIARDGDVGPDVLVELGRVDVDVDLLGLRRIRRQPARDAVVESHAEGDEQVGVLDGFVHPRLTVHAHHAEVERVRRWQRADAEQRDRHGQVRELGQLAEFLRGPALEQPVPGEDDGPLGARDERSGLFDQPIAE